MGKIFVPPGNRVIAAYCSDPRIRVVKGSLRTCLRAPAVAPLRWPGLVTQITNPNAALLDGYIHAVDLFARRGYGCLCIFGHSDCAWCNDRGISEEQQRKFVRDVVAFSTKLFPQLVVLGGWIGFSEERLVPTEIFQEEEVMPFEDLQAA